jgi:integrase
VPVHPLLVRLGLLDHIADMRRKGERQLFPELERGGPDQRFGYAFSKDFTEYRRAIGAYEPGRDFHALRHSVSTALFNAGVDTSVVSAILGHAQVGVSAGVYLSGYKLAKLAEAITALDFGLDEVLMRRGRG